MKFNRLCNSVGEVRHHGRLKNVIRVRLVFGQQREVDIHQLEYALHQVDAAQQGQHFADHAPAYLHQREAITDICPAPAHNSGVHAVALAGDRPVHFLPGPKTARTRC